MRIIATLALLILNCFCTSPVWAQKSTSNMSHENRVAYWKEYLKKHYHYSYSIIKYAWEGSDASNDNPAYETWVAANNAKVRFNLKDHIPSDSDVDILTTLVKLAKPVIDRQTPDKVTVWKELDVEFVFENVLFTGKDIRALIPAVFQEKWVKVFRLKLYETNILEKPEITKYYDIPYLDIYVENAKKKIDPAVELFKNSNIKSINLNIPSSRTQPLVKFMQNAKASQVTLMSGAIGKDFLQGSVANNLKISKLQSPDLPASFLEFMTFETVDMADNQLVGLPANFFKETKIKNLVLANNKFSNIPQAVNQNKDIENIDLSGNLITSLKTSSSAEDLNFNNLNLSKNKFKQLIFPELLVINKLNLSNNEITEMKLTSSSIIDHLDLRRNSLKDVTIPENIKLGKVYFSKNQITSCKISPSAKIQHLDLQKNNITTLEDNTFRGVVMKSFNLKGNNVSIIGANVFRQAKIDSVAIDLGAVRRIGDYFLADAKISLVGAILLPKVEKIGTHFCAKNSGIEKVSLKNSQLGEAGPFFTSDSSVREIDLSGTKLTKFPNQFLEGVRSLRKLSLANIGLDALPNNFGRIKARKMNFINVDLSGNKIEDLPADDLKQWPEEVIFNFRNNPLGKLRKDFVATDFGIRPADFDEAFAQRYIQDVAPTTFFPGGYRYNAFKGSDLSPVLRNGATQYYFDSYNGNSGSLDYRGLSLKGRNQSFLDRMLQLIPESLYHQSSRYNNYNESVESSYIGYDRREEAWSLQMISVINTSASIADFKLSKQKYFDGINLSNNQFCRVDLSTLKKCPGYLNLSGNMLTDGNSIIFPANCNKFGYVHTTAENFFDNVRDHHKHIGPYLRYLYLQNNPLKTMPKTGLDATGMAMMKRLRLPAGETFDKASVPVDLEHIVEYKK